jgi:polyhydroxybutyrate depolymerase
VFVTGMSNGAMMSLRLACQSNRFSAVAAVAGNLPEPLATRCKPAGKDVLLIHGVDDAIVPYAGGYVSGIRPGNKRGRVLSAKQTFALLGKANGCQATREIPVRDLFHVPRAF